MKYRVVAFSLLLFVLTFMISGFASAFTPDELVNLKKTGLSEKLIVQLVQLGYGDVSTLLKLKEAGFSDDAILTLVESGMKTENNGKVPVEHKPQVAELVAEAKVKIVWYLIYRGKPVVRNHKEIDKAIVALTGKTLSVAWPAPQGMAAFRSVLNVEPFTSPFLWDIAPSDTVDVKEGENQIILRSSPAKLGRPKSDETGYYELYLVTSTPHLIESLKAFR